MKHKEPTKPTTLIDRFGMAALSGLLTFVSVLVLWLLVVFAFGVTAIPFEIVLWLSGIMTVLGFVLAETVVVSVLSKLWEAIYAFFVSYR